MNQFSSKEIRKFPIGKKEIKIKDPLQRDVKKPNYFYTFIIQKKKETLL